ncbi:MAG: DivIVA domain-containing protein [Micrococcaceae bacterium]
MTAKARTSTRRGTKRAPLSSDPNEANPFSTTSRKNYGYDPKQVDEFIRRARHAYHGDGAMTAAEVRSTAFDAVKGGYAAHQVDQVLDRLEDAFLRTERDELIQKKGMEAWNTSLDELIRRLMTRLDRPEGERFRRPSREESMSYHVQDVDTLCRKLRGHLTDESSVSVTDLRVVSFRSVQGSQGYEEGQVDAFIEDAVELLTVLD